MPNVATYLVVLGVGATLLSAPTGVAVATQHDQQPSCWADQRYNEFIVCFDGSGHVDMSIFYAGASGEGGHGAEVTGRYWGSGNTIHFEAEWPYDPWPWNRAQVVCTLGGPEGVMELTACRGSGGTFAHTNPAADTQEIDLTLVRIKTLMP